MYAAEPKRISALLPAPQFIWGADPAQLRLIVDALPVLIAHVDAAERFRFNNRAYELWFGLSLEQFSGRSLREVFGEAAYEHFAPHLQKTLQGQKQFFEAVLSHNQLADRSVQVYCIPAFSGRETNRSLWLLITDVTEHRQAERRVLGLVNTAHEGIWEMDDRGKTMGVNGRLAELLGWSPEEMRGRNLFDIVAPEERETAAAQWKELMRGIPQSGEWRLLRKDRPPVWTLVSCSPVADGHGATIGALAMVVDITERKLEHVRIRSMNADLERRVQERTAQLLAINKELEAFCYSVSHDLRAPLRTIRGFGDVLLEQYVSQLDSRGQDFLRRTCEASAGMDRLIEDLLRLSRVSRSELRAEDVNLSLIAEDIMGALSKADPERVVEVGIAPDLRAHGDSRLLRLVLDNLLRNAWKFTSRTGAARIEFDYKPEPEGAFFVADNGAGFDMRYAEKLFGVFQRLHSTSDYPGSGVGLAIVQRIISRHGGRTWATGEVGRGATVYFTLPEMNPC